FSPRRFFSQVVEILVSDAELFDAQAGSDLSDGFGERGAFPRHRGVVGSREKHGDGLSSTGDLDGVAVLGALDEAGEVLAGFGDGDFGGSHSSTSEMYMMMYILSKRSGFVLRRARFGPA